MKKILTALSMALILASTASADIARVEVGAGLWMQTPAGEIKENIDAKEDSEISPYIWAIVKHPVPIIPNARVEYVSVESGKGNLSLEISQIDLIPYYNLLDNTFWLTLDVGVDLKILKATHKATGTETESLILPMLYVRTRFQLPFSGLAAEADIKYVSFDDNTVTDMRVKLDYTLTFFPIIQPAVEVGYRVQTVETDELVGKMNLDFAGVYAGVNLRF